MDELDTGEFKNYINFSRSEEPSEFHKLPAPVVSLLQTL